MATYRNKELPSEFTEGYELADQIDRRLKKGQYEPTPDQPLDVEMVQIDVA